MPAAAVFDFEVVTTHEASRRYGRRRALAKVTTTFRAGEVTVLLGPNGAGKSTLLALLSTLLRPTSGALQYGGRSAEDAGDALRGRIGMLGHDLFLYGDLTARENLAFFGRLYRVSDLESRIAAALDHARLSDRGGDRVNSYSRGMRQRLALERALIHAPRLVLLDEPFTGLDDESAELLAQRLGTLRDAGAIVVVATHDFDTADVIADRALCLRDGRARELPAGAGTLRDRYRAALREGWT